ncbi:FIMAH domain-containing protein [Rossellomorea vietnamensis]|uniref:FIMAH domain-containing protein n=1 Tax=Rossellomorea vietnamensis TaxID=218284 RepID=UPI003D2A61EF
MKKNVKVSGFVSLIFVMMMGAMFTPAGAASADTTPSFGEPVKLGDPIQSVAVYDSAYGKESGHDVMYTTSSGHPAIFQVVDLETEEVLRTYPLEGTGSVWTHITVPNGNVYIGGNGYLYEYSPETQEVKNLGGIGESVVYGLSYDEEGRVYFGSYPNAKAGMYDPATGEMTDFGNVAPNESYTRSTAYHDGYLYLGVGVDNYLVKLNVETGEHEKISLPDHVIQGTSVWQLDAFGDYIVAGVGGGDNSLLFYDTTTNSWEDTYYENNKGLRLIQGLPGSNKAYFQQGGRIMEIDYETLQATDTGVRFGTFIRNTSWVELEGDPDFPGYSLVTVQFAGQVTFMNLETKKVKTIQYPVVGNPIPIQTLEKGPDGNMYMSGYPGGKGAVYNTSEESSEMFTLGQAEGMVAMGDHMYFGVYTGATVWDLDTTKDTIAPKQIYDIPHQDRPFKMEAVNGKLYIGTIPDYGKLGGSLTILDPGAVEDTKVFENVIHNQSIVGLAEQNGKLYGSTTVAGGLGITPTEEAAKLFVWDLEKNEKITEFVPDIPGLDYHPNMISGMSVGPDGLLWSAADGTIFAMDPESLEIVKSKTIYEGVKDYGRWRPIHIRWDDNGVMYTTLAGKLTAIDPESFDYETLAVTELATIGDDGDIYYTSESRLMKIDVLEYTLESARDLILKEAEDGQIKHSVEKQLVNSLTQAIHHRDKGHTDQARKHLQKALDQFERAKDSDVTNDLKVKLALKTIEL